MVYYGTHASFNSEDGTFELVPGEPIFTIGDNERGLNAFQARVKFVIRLKRIEAVFYFVDFRLDSPTKKPLDDIIIDMRSFISEYVKEFLYEKGRFIYAYSSEEVRGYGRVPAFPVMILTEAGIWLDMKAVPQDEMTRILGKEMM